MLGSAYSPLEMAQSPSFDIEEHHNSFNKLSDVDNLDTFFCDMYAYYIHGGFRGLVLTRLSNLLSLAFTIVFSSWLLLFINWSGILSCGAEDQCHSTPLHSFPSLSLARVVVLTYTAVFSLYWIVQFFAFIDSTRKAMRMKSFYSSSLSLPDRSLKAISWSDIMAKLELAQSQGHIRLSHVKDHGAVDVANRIMRRDNFLIALVADESLFPKHILLGSPMITEAFLVYLDYILLKPMFSNNFTLRKSYTPLSFQRRCMVMGMLSLVFLPCTLLFMMVFFFLKHFESVYRSKAGNSFKLFQRTWSPLGFWTTRQFSELPHLYSRRMESKSAHDAAGAYLQQFPRPATDTLFRLVSYASGSIVGVLLAVLAIGDTDTMTNFHVLGRSLLWWTGLWSAVLAASRSCGGTPSNNEQAPPEKLMENVVRHTYYWPIAWRGACHRSWVRKEFTLLYRTRILGYVDELVCVLTLWYVLLYSLPKRAELIVDFVKEHMEDHEGIGNICSLSVSTKPEPFGNYADSIAVADIPGNSNSETVKLENMTQELRDKMRASHVVFAIEHPMSTRTIPRSYTEYQSAAEGLDTVHGMSRSDLLLAMSYSELLADQSGNNQNKLTHSQLFTHPEGLACREADIQFP